MTLREALPFANEAETRAPASKKNTLQKARGKVSGSELEDVQYLGLCLRQRF